MRTHALRSPLCLLKNSSLLTGLKLPANPGILSPMLTLILRTLASVLRSRHALVLENLALRHQIRVLKRSGRRLRLSPLDRGLWVVLSRIWNDWRDSLVLAKPETVVR